MPRRQSVAFFQNSFPSEKRRHFPTTSLKGLRCFQSKSGSAKFLPAVHNDWSRLRLVRHRRASNKSEDRQQVLGSTVVWPLREVELVDLSLAAPRLSNNEQRHNERRKSIAACSRLIRPDDDVTARRTMVLLHAGTLATGSAYFKTTVVNRGFPRRPCRMKLMVEEVSSSRRFSRAARQLLQCPRLPAQHFLLRRLNF